MRMNINPKDHKFTDLFIINSNNVRDYSVNKKKKTRSELIENSGKKILNKFGVYFLSDIRIKQKTNKKYLDNLIYIGQAGGNIQKNMKSGEDFYDRIHKHWLKSIGADKKNKYNPITGISVSVKWIKYREQKCEYINYKKNFNILDSHKFYRVAFIPMRAKTMEDKSKIKMLESFALYKFHNIHGYYPICNTEKPKREHIKFFQSFEKL